MRSGLAHWLTVLMTGPGSPQGRGQTVLTHTTPRHCSTSEGRSNPTVYHYTRYRLNTRPGEGMTECVVYACVSECVHPSMHFSSSGVDVDVDARVCVCVCVCVCVGLLACLTLRLLRLLYISGDQRRVCVQACLCVRLHNAEQPRLSPQTWKKKKRKKVTARRPLWNTRCSFGKSRQLGCLHFSDWEGKKTRCPRELLSSVHTEITYIAMGDRPVCVCVCVCVCVWEG